MFKQFESNPASIHEAVKKETSKTDVFKVKSDLSSELHKLFSSPKTDDEIVSYVGTVYKRSVENKIRAGYAINVALGTQSTNSKSDVNEKFEKILSKDSIKKLKKIGTLDLISNVWQKAESLPISLSTLYELAIFYGKNVNRKNDESVKKFVAGIHSKLIADDVKSDEFLNDFKSAEPPKPREPKKEIDWFEFLGLNEVQKDTCLNIKIVEAFADDETKNKFVETLGKLCKKHEKHVKAVSA